MGLRTLLAVPAHPAPHTAVHLPPSRLPSPYLACASSEAQAPPSPPLPPPLPPSSYLLRLYLRTRLRKLEAQAAHILGDDALMQRLGTREQSYVQVRR